jgi:hypothetical protein
MLIQHNMGEAGRNSARPNSGIDKSGKSFVTTRIAESLQELPLPAEVISEQTMR